MMKYLLFIFSFGLLIISSCGKHNDGCDEDKVCYTLKPDSLYIELQLSPPPNNEFVEVEFYIGNVDDGELFLSFTTSNSLEYFHMPVGEEYSAKAYYNEGEKTTVVVEGKELKSESFENCEITCYVWDDLIFDLTLKD